MASLEDVRVELKGIGERLASGRWAVPRYQRAYMWKDQQIQDLIKDIGAAIDRKVKQYFLGSVVITHDEKDDRPHVVDGQQRLATVSILVAAIRDYFQNTGDQKRATNIESVYLMKPDLSTLEPIPNLILNAADNDFFLQNILIDPKNRKTLAPTRPSHRRIHRAQELAQAHVQNIASGAGSPTSRLVDWIEFIANRVRVIWWEVPDYSDAFTIFETLNDRGLKLAISDLLKNYLFYVADDRMPEAEQAWISMTGSLEEEVTVDFIRHHWSSREGLTRERELFDAIKTKINTKQAAVEFANELSDNAKLYSALLHPDDELLSKYGTETSVHLATLKLLRVERMRPLMLSVLRSFSIQEAKKAFRLLVNWAVRFLVTKRAAGTIEQECSRQAKQVYDGHIKTAAQLAKAMNEAVVPSDVEFRARFQSEHGGKSNVARYYLRVLENQENGEKQPELVPNPNEAEINLEHVLPRNPSADWKHVKPEIARGYYSRLGNLALMKSAENAKAGNEGFNDKKARYKTSKFKLTSEIAAAAGWGPDEIETRQSKMADLSVKAWPGKL